MKKAGIFAACLLLAVLTACGAKQTEPEPVSSPEPAQTGTAAETVPDTTQAESEAVRSADDVIGEIVTYHGSYGKDADGKVQELLAELGGMDSRQGKLWTDIMQYWDYANDELEVHTDSLPDDLPQDDSLCIVVLGFELNDDGTMKDELIGRLNTAKACAEQYPNAFVVCTGGGTAKDNPDATEADLMGEWLLEHGLDKTRLIIENRSLTTAENANFSYDILLHEYPQVHSVAIVSSSYHIAWGSLLFEAEFMKIASEQETPEMHVISNCAYETTNDDYRMSDMLRWETGGMLQLIGRQDLAMAYYADTYEKPLPAPEAAAESPASEERALDYLVLVNKENKLPDDWEDMVSLTTTTNSLGDEVVTEELAYEAYLQLRDALLAEDVHVDLDSAYRSVEAQQRIVEDFTEKYGEDYVRQYVAVPGFSEHHTGLALDLYLNIDGQDVYLNEDMVEYPEIWAKIHEKLPEYGFILRYPEGREDITGYSYEPWHIRFVGKATAKQIAEEGVTLEEYLAEDGTE